MDVYPNSSPYVSVVPRLLPSQYSAKKIPMLDEGYQYVDNRLISSNVNPSIIQNNSQLLSTDNIIYPNQSVDNPFKTRNSKNRVHLEALKDNSGDQFSSNPSPYSGYGYSSNLDYKSYENFKQSPSQDNSNKNSFKIFIIFGILIGLFSITALAISIYLLIKLSTTTTILG